MQIDELVPLLEKEMQISALQYGAYHSAHEHLGVYLEEFEEWKDCVKDNTSNTPQALYELLQGAAVCLRYIIEHGDAEHIAEVQRLRYKKQ